MATLHQREGEKVAPVRLEEAFERMIANLPPATSETVPLQAAIGRRLAEPIVAPCDLWAFPRAAMDGFAVRSSEVATASYTSPVRLRVVATLYAGQTGARIGLGEAVRIMTGAPLPDGADAVIPLEQVRTNDAEGFVEITQPVSAGKNVFPAAEDARAGQVVLKAGDLVTPFALGLLSALGISQVSVYRPPKVGVVAVGDELVDATCVGNPTALETGQVVDANSPALLAALVHWGAEVTPLGIIPDDLKSLQTVLERAQGLALDLLILTGGASVGDRDYTRQALLTMGADFLFAGLLVKPGKPTAAAKLGRCLVFVLPGSPSAAMAMATLLVAPVVRALSGVPLTECKHPVLKARLMHPVRSSPGRPHYLWGRLAFCAGIPAVWALGTGSIAALRPQALANALIALPEEGGQWPAGTLVEVVWFDQHAPQFAWSPIPALGIIGPQNSGKTTLLERLIPELQRRGLRVAAIKHAPHGFDIDYEGKDTWRMAQAGASTVAVAGMGATAAIWRSRELALAELLSFVGEGVQLVLVEGFKEAPIPKIELVPAGNQPTTPADQLLLVVSEGMKPNEPRWFTPEDIPAIAEVVLLWLQQWEQKVKAAAGAD